MSLIGVLRCWFCRLQLRRCLLLGIKSWLFPSPIALPLPCSCPSAAQLIPGSLQRHRSHLAAHQRAKKSPLAPSSLLLFCHPPLPLLPFCNPLSSLSALSSADILCSAISCLLIGFVPQRRRWTFKKKCFLPGECYSNSAELRNEEIIKKKTNNKETWTCTAAENYCLPQHFLPFLSLPPSFLPLYPEVWCPVKENPIHYPNHRDCIVKAVVSTTSEGL